MRYSIVFLFLFLTMCGKEDNIYDLIRDNQVDKAIAFIEKDSGLINKPDENKMTLLHHATQFSEPKLVEYLIKKGADVNALSYNNFTPLHNCKSPQNARVLDENGALFSKIDVWGNTPLQKIAQEENTELSRVFLELGAELDIVSALYLKKREAVIKMVEENPDVVKSHTETMDLWGNNTPLGIVAGQGDIELVKLFISNGAPIDGGTYRPNAGNFTPLCNAVWANQHEIVKILFEKGASLDVSGGKFYRTISEYVEKVSDPKMKELFKTYTEKRKL